MMPSSRKILAAKESSLVATFILTATVQVVETSSHQKGCRCRVVSPGRLQAVCSAYTLYNPIYSLLHLYYICTHCTLHIHVHMHMHMHMHMQMSYTYLFCFRSQWLYTAPYIGSGCTLHLHLHIHEHMQIYLHMSYAYIF